MKAFNGMTMFSKVQGIDGILLFRTRWDTNNVQEIIFAAIDMYNDQ